MYAIYGNIYHQYTPVLLAYIPYMDPMGYNHDYDYDYIMAFSLFPKEMKWSKCWGNAIIGKGLEHGEVHGPLVSNGVQRCFPSQMENGDSCSGLSSKDADFPGMFMCIFTYIYNDMYIYIHKYVYTS